MISRSARALDAVVDEWCVFGGDPGALDFLGREVVPDANPGDGPLEGLLSALQHFDGRAVILLACDLPFVGAAHLRAISDRAATENLRGAAAVVAAQGGRVQPLCGWYSAGCSAPIASALRAGQRSVMSLLDGIQSVRLEFSDAGCLDNVNSPDDYEDARRRLPSVSSPGAMR